MGRLAKVCFALLHSKYINNSLQIIKRIFYLLYVFFCKRVFERYSFMYRKIPSPDSSAKPVPVENHFFQVVAERPKEAPDSA
jgi:hypothetical protein